MEIDFVNKIVEEEEILYHYTTLSVAQNYILKNLTLLASPLRKVNDPKEYKNKSYIHNYDKNIKELNEKVNEYFLDFSKIICFSQDNKNGNTHYDAGYFKSRMWSQYGENHKGVCIGFKKIKIIEAYNKTSNYFFKNHGDIIYTNEIHTNLLDYTLPFSSNILKDKRDEITEICCYLGRNHRHFYFEKVKDWQDENEYRLVFLNLSKEDYYLDISEAIHSVYLGLDFPDEMIATLKKTIPKSDVRIHKLGSINTLIYPKNITDREYI